MFKVTGIRFLGSFVLLYTCVLEIIFEPRQEISNNVQGSKISLVRSYLRVPQAAGQVKILIFLVKTDFYPYMPIIFVMQGKCLF